MVIAM